MGAEKWKRTPRQATKVWPCACANINVSMEQPCSILMARLGFPWYTPMLLDLGVFTIGDLRDLGGDGGARGEEYPPGAGAQQGDEASAPTGGGSGGGSRGGGSLPRSEAVHARPQFESAWFQRFNLMKINFLST